MRTAYDVRLQRVYGRSAAAGGKRVLVDRVWPRGLKKESLALDLWLRDLGPSDELRRWFGHRPDRWPGFQRRYRIGLTRPPQGGVVDERGTPRRSGALPL